MNVPRIRNNDLGPLTRWLVDPDRCNYSRNFVVYSVFRSIRRSLLYDFCDTPLGVSMKWAGSPGTYNNCNPWMVVTMTRPIRALFACAAPLVLVIAGCGGG